MNINGVSCKLIIGRVSEEKRDQSKHYYCIRHSDRNFNKPITVEKHVMVNYYGVLECDSPMEVIENGGYIDLTKERKIAKAIIEEDAG